MQSSTSSFLNVIDPASVCSSMPHTLAMEDKKENFDPKAMPGWLKYPLDPFQQHAVAAISRDENVLVTAKTGSGKTLVGEYQIAHSLAKGRRVFYTTPIKSLSNQKFHDLKAMFPSVGIMTGDLKFRPDADVVIMTTEILRNLLFKANSAATRNLGITADLSLDRLDAVVFDECHYINDRDRGAVWEETLILLPPEVNLVLLSATIDAPEFFAGWLGDLKKKPIHLISTQYRIVPLQHGVYRGDELLTIMDSKDRFESGLYKAWLLWRAGQVKAVEDHRARVSARARGGYEDGAVARSAVGPKAYKAQMNDLIGYLEQQELLPALFFVFSRKDCERYAASVEHTLIDSNDVATVKHVLSFHLHRYGEELQRLPQYQTLRALLEKGIAFHHSGLLPVLKEMVEILFGRGLVRLLFATETFAVGINMPTKTVVFTGYRKYDDATGGMRMLNTDEYIQMAGRAGRRGKDDKGLVLYLPDREPEALEDVKRMMTGARATFQSRMTFHYDFLLKTLQAGNLDWLEIMKQSYWQRRQDQILEGCKRDLAALEKEQTSLGLGVADLEDLLERERLLTSVSISVNAARKAAQAAWSSWENRHMGPVWAKRIKEMWPKWKMLGKEIEARRGDLEHYTDGTKDIWARLEALAEFGLLETTMSTPPSSLKLTKLGTSATEVNEGHEILMAVAFDRKLFHRLLGKEHIAALACFLKEGQESAGLTGLDGQDIPDAVRNTIYKIQDTADQFRTEEKMFPGAALEGVGDPFYWDMNIYWIEPLWRWLEGATMVELCAEYGIYEGNMLRVLMKMVNLLEEWRCIATLAEDVDQLEKLKGLELEILRDVAITDSLYLRI
jgi:superfamily II RNA helicase